ncbi:NAD(+) diphosphatase [Mobilicoccus pelagius]|uniref:NAD(+) diphosphatase n=1 Tax=Mobilicoccus pelagius NBRC 104925 TaxID=1089455 RepID=H5URQ6_9MICO|nr:NAD(+) diphosphatase [Mobilicoccus pelagius]GAB48414.1 NADH pyrophosphatase [Mobilicoccus pelagius NBRC 104925]
MSIEPTGGQGSTGTIQERVGLERAAWDASAALADPGTRVLEIIGDKGPVEVARDGSGPVLRWRAPRPEDAGAELVVLLGRAPGQDPSGGTPGVHAGRGADLVAVVRPAPPTGDDAPGGRVATDDTTDDITDDITDEDGATVAWRALREVGPWMDATDVAWWMTAQGLVLWHRTHRFCSRCGSPTRVASAGWMRVCEKEERESYPRTDPAVIMGIRDAEDRLLLARSPMWPEGRRSVLAGFVEPGESLEDAVRREVAEEVGLRVVRTEYVASQPWPFPASLMLGFAGWADGTALERDPGEIAEAEWYTREEVRAGVEAGTLLLPGRMSIARRLVEDWYGERLFVPGVDELGGEAWARPS